MIKIKRLLTRRSILKSQRGSVSILFALGVASVGGLVVFQLASMYNMVNRLHTAQKNSFEISQDMHRLGSLLKHSFDLAQMYPGCTGVKTEDAKPSKVKLYKKEFNGITLCLPDSKELCVRSSEDSVRSCISLQPNMLNWKYKSSSGKGNDGNSLSKFFAADSRAPSGKLDNNGGTGSSGSKHDGKSVGSSSATKNVINIPPRATSSLWRSCNTSTCIRMVLCRNGKTNCDLKDAEAVQVVRFGNLN